MEGGDCGTFSVWREWTDRDPANGGVSDHQGGPVLAQAALVELATLLAAWRAARKKD